MCVFNMRTLFLKWPLLRTLSYSFRINVVKVKWGATTFWFFIGILTDCIFKRIAKNSLVTMIDFQCLKLFNQSIYSLFRLQWPMRFKVVLIFVIFSAMIIINFDLLHNRFSMRSLITSVCTDNFLNRSIYHPPLSLSFFPSSKIRSIIIAFVLSMRRISRQRLDVLR
jgi:hypothetical protein